MGVYRGPVDEILFLPVRVSLPHADVRKLQLRSSAVPVPVEVRLIIDTGSQRSALKPSVLRYPQCPSRHSVRVQTSTGEGQAKYDEVGMEFLTSSLAALPRAVVVGLDLPPRLQDYSGVIGRDILGGWEFYYSGPRRRLTIRDHRSFLGWLCS
jgi:hypothetical protein